MQQCYSELRTVTFGRGGQPVARRCSCSEVWLQERRSEQHTVRPSLFIREEMMLQPQPHIDLLIRSPAVDKLQDAATSWSLQFTLSCLQSCNVFHMVLIHRYSVKDRTGFIYTQHKAHLIEVHELGSTVYQCISLVITSHFLYSSCCTACRFRAVPPAVEPPTTAELTSIHKTPSFDCKGQTGRRVCHHSLPAPTLSIRFFPLPQLPLTAVH